jgi:hypothetical protein
MYIQKKIYNIEQLNEQKNASEKILSNKEKKALDNIAICYVQYIVTLSKSIWKTQ